jgi:hypothetical protein
MSQSTKRRLSAICNCCDQPFAATGVSRRQFFAAGVVAFAATSLPARVFAQAKPHRIDVHHHVTPPSWLNAMDIIGRTNPPLANWSVWKTLDDMDKGAVATAILSPTAPQVVPLGKGVGVKIAREANEYSKKLSSGLVPGSKQAVLRGVGHRTASLPFCGRVRRAACDRKDLGMRFKPPAHLAVWLPAWHMSHADPTGSMTPWRQS